MNEQTQIVGWIVCEANDRPHYGHPRGVAWFDENGDIKFAAADGLYAEVGEKVLMEKGPYGMIVKKILSDNLLPEGFKTVGLITGVLQLNYGANRSEINVVVKHKDGSLKLQAADCETELFKHVKNNLVNVEVQNSRPLRLIVTGIAGKQPVAA